jgi:hypothetical protein
MIITSGRIAEDSDSWCDQLLGHLVCICADCLGTVGKVGLRDRGCHGIDLHRDNLKTSARERYGIRTDSTSQINDSTHVGFEKPLCMVLSDFWSRRLFQTGSCEEHLQRRIAELRPSLPPQSGLSERSCGKLRAVTGTHPRSGCQ